MSKLFTGSICLSDLITKAKEGHSAFSKANNGKMYVNIKMWENDQPDKFGNTISIQLNSTQEKRESEGTFYIGNAKAAGAKVPEQVTGKEEELNDLPF